MGKLLRQNSWSGGGLYFCYFDGKLKYTKQIVMGFSIYEDAV